MNRLAVLPLVFILAPAGCMGPGHLQATSHVQQPADPTASSTVDSRPAAPMGKPQAPPNNRDREATIAEDSTPIVDSNLTLAQALDGSDGPEDVRSEQLLVDVRYYSFDGRLHQGQILIKKELASDVSAIFQEIEKSHFPIAKCVPISKYGWSDDASVADDNTSGFNYREIPATHHLSLHASGRAIDLNPWQNPYDDPIRGTAQAYDTASPGTLTRNSPPTVAFRRHGWSWGGVWRRGRDYQHFEKRGQS